MDESAVRSPHLSLSDTGRPATAGPTPDVDAPEPMTLRIGDFELDTASGDLGKGGTPVHIQPKPLSVLSVLARFPGQTVRREYLIEQVWGRDHYGDHDRGLNHCIKEVRRALGDDASRPTYIETIPRRGYRLIADVEPVVPKPAGGGRFRTTRGLADTRIWRVAATLLLAAAVPLGIASLVRTPTVNATPQVRLTPITVGAAVGDVDCPYRFERFMERDLQSSIGELMEVVPTVEQAVVESSRALLLTASFDRIGDNYRTSLQLTSHDGVPLWSGLYEVPVATARQAGPAAARRAADELKTTLTRIATERDLQVHAGIVDPPVPLLSAAIW